MPNLFAFPFRVAVNGTIITRDDDSDQCYTEELAMLCLTQPGERELVPSYGISDPVFGEFNQAELISKVSTFLPEIRVREVRSSYPRQGEQNLTVEYETINDENNQSEDTYDA